MRKIVWALVISGVLLSSESSAVTGTITTKPPKKKPPNTRPQNTKPPKVKAGKGKYGLLAQNGGTKSDTWDTKRVVARARICNFSGDFSSVVVIGRTDPVYVVGRKTCTNADGLNPVDVIGQFCVQNCPGAATTTQVIEYPTAPEVLDQLITPVPTPRLSPKHTDVISSNIGGYLVGMPTFFAVEPSSWQPVNAPSVIRGPHRMDLTATPVGLEITLDNNTFDCNGPGIIVTNKNEYKNASDDCSVTFTENGTAKLRIRIRYVHTYIATGFVPIEPLPVNEESFSPALTLSLPVVEVQAVIKNQP